MQYLVMKIVFTMRCFRLPGIVLLTTILFFTITPVNAQKSKPVLQYTVSVADTANHYFQVTLNCRGTRSTTSAASSSTPRPSTPSPTRPPTRTSASCRASKPPCCSPTRRATVRPRAVSRTASRRSRSASKSASPIRWRTRISALPRC